MDNEQYLKQISAKPVQVAAAKKTFVITPFMIKAAAGGLILIILLVVISNILAASGVRARVLTETLYSRLTALSRPGGPIDEYGDILHSSHLRSLTTNFRTNITNISRDLEGLLPNLQIERNKISTSVTNSETARITEFTDTLEVARLNSLLDRTFAREITLQIAELLSMESELYERTNNRALQDLLHRSTTDLRLLEIEFTDYNNSSR